MGTRARINIFEMGVKIDNQILVSIYVHWDGYPSGLGANIAKFSKDMKIINGIPIGDPNIIMGKAANGIGCYAAQLIKHLKEEIGNVSLRNTSEKSHGEEYVYNVRKEKGEIWIDVLSGRMTAFGCPGDPVDQMTLIFSGLAKDFNAEEFQNTD